MDEKVCTGNLEKEKTTQHLAALSIGVICILIGLPLWWKTTEVYRVSLPYTDIQHLSDNKLEFMVEVDVIWAAATNKKDSLFLSDLALQLSRSLDSKQFDGKTLSSIFRVAVREADDPELLALQKVSKLSDLQPILSSDNLNKYNIIVTKPSSIITQPVLAPGNNVFLPYNGAAVEGLSAQIVHLLMDVIRMATLTKSVEAAQGLRAQRPDKDIMRSFRFHSGYDITFTLMIPEPDHINVQWDIANGVEDYFRPLLDSLESYTNISVTSQVLYFISLGGQPKKGDNYFYFSEQDLPHVINPLETKLGFHASNNPGLNFIVYIPTKNRSPLYIHDKNGAAVPSNSFLSPRWGGVMIYNPQMESSSNGSDVHPLPVDMHQIMEVFVTQSRLLLNINPHMATKELKVLSTGDSKLVQWELAGWLRSRCAENILTATLSLQSLAQLLEEIGNIVINDDIGKEVESAVASIKESKLLLKSGKLKEAFLASKAAVESSELAFFHPSLLELLYFPEDQKFAIYIPLFLPISIPVLTTMLQAIKWFRELKKSKQD